MSQELVRRNTPEERELSKKREELSNLQGVLAQRELDLVTLLAELHAFERRYFRIVGVRYAELDEIEAQIAEHLSQASPQNKNMHARAGEARARADESARTSRTVQEARGRGEKFKPDDALKKVYREAAKRIHPDLGTDEEDRTRRQRVMAEINEAYEEGDETRVREILREWESSPDAIKGDGVAMELVRVIRKIAQVQARLTSIDATIDGLRSSDLYRLKEEVESAEVEERDLLADMAARLDQQLAEARKRLAGLTREQPSHA